MSSFFQVLQFANTSVALISELGHQPGRCQSRHRFRRVVEPVSRQSSRLSGLQIWTKKDLSHLPLRHGQLPREEDLRQTGFYFNMLSKFWRITWVRIIISKITWKSAFIRGRILGLIRVNDSTRVKFELLLQKLAFIVYFWGQADMHVLASRVATRAHRVLIFAFDFKLNFYCLFKILARSLEDV